MVPDQFDALGIFKAMQKKSIKYYPVIGWDFWFCENIFLARDAKRDIKTIENDIERLADSKERSLKNRKILKIFIFFSNFEK